MKTRYLLLSMFAAFGLTQCTDEGMTSNLTRDLAKIETSYSAGAVKIEGPTSKPKIETAASDYDMDEVARKVDEEIQKAMTSRTSSRTSSITDYDIGIPTDANTPCSNGEKIMISMDCEDNGGLTEVFPIGIAGAPWTVNSNQNIKMYFCRVDGFSYGSYYGFNRRHAVLKLGALNPSGSTKQLLRYFDNEDYNNTNSHTGDISPNSQGRNTALTFHIFPAVSGGMSPFFMSSYVITDEGYPNTTYYKYYIDDEDSNNEDYWKINGGSRTSSSGETFIYGDHNTTIKISRLN